MFVRLPTDRKAGRARVSFGGFDRGHAYFHRPLQAWLEVGIRQLSEGNLGTTSRTYHDVGPLDCCSPGVVAGFAGSAYVVHIISKPW